MGLTITITEGTMAANADYQLTSGYTIMVVCGMDPALNSVQQNNTISNSCGKSFYA